MVSGHTKLIVCLAWSPPSYLAPPTVIKKIEINYLDQYSIGSPISKSLFWNRSKITYMWLSGHRYLLISSAVARWSSNPLIAGSIPGECRFCKLLTISAKVPTPGIEPGPLCLGVKRAATTPHRNLLIS